MSLSVSVDFHEGAVLRPAQPVSHLEGNRPWLERVLTLPGLSAAARRLANALARHGFGEIKVYRLLWTAKMLSVDVHAGLAELEGAGVIVMRPSVRVTGYRWIAPVG